MVQELSQHMRIINSKLDNNLTAINDFKQLLLQTRSEIVALQQDDDKEEGEKLRRQ